jgi:hypothetical protein
VGLDAVCPVIVSVPVAVSINDKNRIRGRLHDADVARRTISQR